MAKKVSTFWSPRALPQTRASAFLVFVFIFAMKRCSIAAKIAGSIGILSQRGMNVCPIWSGSSNRVYMYHVGNKSVTAPISMPTYDRKSETFFGALH